MSTMDKALEAAVEATRRHSFDALTMDEHRDIVREAISAYLAALPATDTSGLVERLRARWEATDAPVAKKINRILRTSEEAADCIEAMKRENTAKDARLAEAEAALQDIADPLAALQRDALKAGSRLSGMAYQIANDPNHLKAIARSYLEGRK